ncbi:class I SAM-dependent methyltransferase [Candidatus Dependentiae bacterium]|nr:class I SAM-dependent methyltransferase [Candidatus Dependentiae bacterium]
MNTYSLYSLYGTLCTEFFDLDKPTPPPLEYEFYKNYVEQAPGEILEPMCGTGRYLIPLCESGFNVHGFDASTHMLNALRTKCAQKGLSPKVWHDFIDTVRTNLLYSLIFIPDSSFVLFLTNEEIIRSLQKLYSLLKPGGIFVFDVETIYAAPSKIGLWQGKAHTRPDGSFILLNTLPLALEDDKATVICRYELCDKGSVIKTEIEYFKIKLYRPGEMMALLEKIGFSSIKEIKAFDPHKIPSAQDYTIVYECIK